MQHCVSLRFSPPRERLEAEFRKQLLGENWQTLQRPKVCNGVHVCGKNSRKCRFNGDMFPEEPLRLRLVHE